jgi:myotubularin-related protein 5/13
MYRKGINHVLKLVCAILADYKIIFYSRSYTKLTDACIAIESLLYPLKYAGVYVPILPCYGQFLEFPSAPTPYIIGIHTNYKRLIEDMHHDCLNDCIKVDLDGSSVQIPLHIEHVATLPQYLHEQTLTLLFSILKPDVLRADEALNAKKSVDDLVSQPIDDPVWVDKQIRAIFIRLYAQLFAGYRYCLLIIRIMPKPVICFHKANFLGHHSLINNEFMNRLLDSMSFARFIEGKA